MAKAENSETQSPYCPTTRRNFITNAAALAGISGLGGTLALTGTLGEDAFAKSVSFRDFLRGSFAPLHTLGIGGTEGFTFIDNLHVVDWTPDDRPMESDQNYFQLYLASMFLKDDHAYFNGRIPCLM